MCIGNSNDFGVPMLLDGPSSNYAVASVEYRLAPEHPFPAGIEDCLDVLDFFFGVASNADAFGIDCTRIGVAGMSAGGYLAAVCAQQTSVPLICQLLFVPMLAPPCTRSYELYSNPCLTRAQMLWFWRNYIGDDMGALSVELAKTDDRVAPLFSPKATLASTPPAVVYVSTRDVLRDEGEMYAQRLSDAIGAKNVRLVHGAGTHVGSLALNSDNADVMRDAARPYFE